MTANLNLPRNATQWTDADGRTLTILEVHPGARDGREVIGTLAIGTPEARRYTCTLPHWQAVWRDKQQRWKGHG